VWPSRDIAEEKGRQSCDGREDIHYLGAEPEAEDDSS
jgi:hypothetical protein